MWTNRGVELSRFPVEFKFDYFVVNKLIASI